MTRSDDDSAPPPPASGGGLGGGAGSGSGAGSGGGGSSSSGAGSAGGGDRDGGGSGSGSHRNPGDDGGAQGPDASGGRRKWPTDRKTLESEVVWNFFRASGPGGQHRNKAETAVRLFHPPSGTTVTATERRSQHQNRELAMERLIAALKRRNHRPKKRKKTKPTKGSQRRRVEQKKQRGQLKKQRRSLDD